MMPLEMATKLASSSATCEKHKCPFMAKCKGDYTTCVMKEIALMLRSQAAEIDSQKAMIDAFIKVVASMQKYVEDLEKVNKRYHDLCIAFQHGYRPRKNVRKPYNTKKKKPKDPVEMDGDERYAYEPPKDKEPDHPLVVI